MRILVTGAGGMLAQALVPELRARGREVLALDRSALDVTDESAVRARIMQTRPDAVVQCAAYTAVDAAEADEAAAHLVNAIATRNVAAACHKLGALIVYPSTDYVFGGSENRPWRPEDPVDPENAYGRTKLAGERAARDASRFLVVRTSWLYGYGGPNFVNTIRRLASERDRLEVVDDQVGRPTWTGSLSRTIADLLERNIEGTYHATDGGEPVSWFGFASAILERLPVAPTLVPVTTEQLGRPARRPAYSVLDCSATEKALERPLPDWRASLEEYFAGLGHG